MKIPSVVYSTEVFGKFGRENSIDHFKNINSEKTIFTNNYLLFTKSLEKR